MVKVLQKLKEGKVFCKIILLILLKSLVQMITIID